MIHAIYPAEDKHANELTVLAHYDNTTITRAKQQDDTRVFLLATLQNLCAHLLPSTSYVIRQGVTVFSVEIGTQCV